MRRILAGAGLSLLLLTGCTTEYVTPDGNQVPQTGGNLSVREQTFTLRDGRTVFCLVADETYHQGGITCDWENAK